MQYRQWLAHRLRDSAVQAAVSSQTVQYIQHSAHRQRSTGCSQAHGLRDIAEHKNRQQSALRQRQTGRRITSSVSCAVLHADLVALFDHDCAQTFSSNLALCALSIHHWTSLFDLPITGLRAQFENLAEHVFFGTCFAHDEPIDMRV